MQQPDHSEGCFRHLFEELNDVVTALPGQMLVDIMGKKGTASLSTVGKLKTAVVTALKTRGHWETLYEAYQVNKLASQLKGIYDDYPSTPEALTDWQETRDELMDEVYAVTGADPKY